MNRYVIVDLDHTLTDAAWRDDLLPTNNPASSWAHYFEGMEHDKLIECTAAIIESLCSDFDIVVVTGRPEEYRDVTLRWIGYYDLPIQKLIMRPTGDHRPSGIVKVDLIKQNFLLNAIAFIIEDRSDCVEAMKCLGRPIFQLWSPNNDRQDAEAVSQGSTVKAATDAR